MNENFFLWDAFKSKELITELSLCTVLLEDKEFPWLLLIPRRPNIRQMNQLGPEDRHMLMDEITAASNLMEQLFPTDMLNVAAIGNKTPQLHVHVICRHKNDSLWPEVIWGREIKKLSPEELLDRAKFIREAWNN
ncbi:MAG: HIT family protein [Holosporaceae bacterium]|jgi:diadenosine tetraphosphate (Ap4A) HIT family hydrolase|nr:HIT family protein [Holosporaceae bacterium]